jgi:UDP-N-acetyl-D-galactosamine dehydrogenase
VDPYYLTYKAESLGYNPQVILAGRRINDGMGAYIANRVMKLLTKKGNAQDAKILILGITFKENCPDIRNSRVIDVIDELKDYGVKLEVYDPHADSEEVMHEYNLDLIDSPGNGYNAVVLAVKHKEFEKLDWSSIKNESTVVFDVKAGLEKEIVSERL